MGIQHRESGYLRAYKAHSTYVENVRQISPFLQNKPKVKYAKINLNSFMTIKYEKVDNWSNQTNKPNFILDVGSLALLSGDKPNPAFTRGIYHSIRVLPGIVDFIGNGLFLVRLNKDTKLNSLAVGLDKIVGLLENIPVYPAIQMFDDPEFDGLVFLVITDFYFESLVEPIVACIDLIMRSFPFAYEVECVARIDTDRFIPGGMVDNILAGEFQLAVIVPAVEPHNTAGQRDAEVVFL